MEIDNGKKYEEAVKVHATVVETMKGAGYSLLKDGETFYRIGMELAPRDGITFSMREAYEIHRFLSSRDTYWKERVRNAIATTNGQPGEIEYSQNPGDAFTTGWQQATAQYRDILKRILLDNLK